MNISDLRRDRARAALQLPFSLPPYRAPYEEWRMDAGIGIIGLHWIVQCSYLPAYRAARYHVVGAAEINDERIDEAVRGGFPRAAIAGDWRVLAQRDDVQVLDCVFGHRRDGLDRRMSVIEEAARHRKHVMIQKPVAYTVAQAKEFARIGQEAGIHVAVNQNCRYQPANYTVKQLLTPERLGRPRLIELSMVWGGAPVAQETQYCHAHADHTIHHADLIRWWVGEPCVAVQAKSSSHTTYAHYEFAGGCIASHCESHHDVGHGSHVRILAEKGSIEMRFDWSWDNDSREYVRVYLAQNEPPVEIPLPTNANEPGWSQANPWDTRSGAFYDLAGANAGMMGSMGSLLRAAETGNPPDNSIDASIASLRMVIAAQHSAQSGQPINPGTIPEDLSVIN